VNLYVCVRFAVDTELVKRKKEKKKRRATKDIFGKEKREKGKIGKTEERMREWEGERDREKKTQANRKDN